MRALVCVVPVRKNQPKLHHSPPRRVLICEMGISKIPSLVLHRAAAGVRNSGRTATAQMLGSYNTAPSVDQVRGGRSLWNIEQMGNIKVFFTFKRSH